jgi:bacteriorhodopsin
MKGQILFFPYFTIIFGYVLAQNLSNRKVFKDQHIKEANDKKIFWSKDIYWMGSWRAGAYNKRNTCELSQT